MNARDSSSTNVLKRDLSSNISLMLLKLEDYGNAIVEAKTCIGYDRSWYKVCHFMSWCIESLFVLNIKMLLYTSEYTA